MAAHRLGKFPFQRVFVLMVVAFSSFPLFVLIPVSLNTSSQLAMPTDGITLDWYRKVAFDTGFPQAALTSLSIALGATVLALVVGGMAAWGITRPNFRWAQPIEAFLLSPLVLARVVYGVAMLLVLSQMGLIRTLSGLIVAHVVIVIPYIVRVIGASLLHSARAVEEAASILGAKQLQVIRFITIPMVRPAIIAAAVFSFIISFDEFTMTVFLAGPQTRTLPVEMFRYVSFVVDPAVAAVSVLLIGMSAVVITIVERTVGLDRLFK